MTTKLYDRLDELDRQKTWLSVHGERTNVYQVIAEKAGMNARNVIDLALYGLHSVGTEKAQRIFSALGSIQGKYITNDEMLRLLADDGRTIERKFRESRARGVTC